MACLSKPQKPLKILTIDGGGLQGLASLLILDKLLNAIAKNNGVSDRKPRPCDVFDVIAGIGPGGWLALLLGRFQMDVMSAYAEWYNLMDCITPNSRAEEIYMRVKQHCVYNRERLIKQTEQLTEFYETGENMFFEPPEDVRCKHVFVSALKKDSKDGHLSYNLFRTYDLPEDARVIEGPDPRKYKISHAFGVTGAAKYFSTPWKEPSANMESLRFLDTKFPCPHNITELALDEMWGLYGEDVDISILVNVGPGIPSKFDCKTIAKRFSWGLTPATAAAKQQKRLSRASIVRANPQAALIDDDGGATKGQEPQNQHKATKNIKFDENITEQTNEADKRKSLTHHPTFGSVNHLSIEEKLKRTEEKIEDNIRKKLQSVYSENPPPYYRLAPEESAPGTTQNDTASPRVSFEATKRYLSNPKVIKAMEEVAQKATFEVPMEA